MAAFVLVQPQPRAGMAGRELSTSGHQAVELAFHRLVPLDSAIAQLAQVDFSEFDRVVFVSPSSVAFSSEVLKGKLTAGEVAAIGQGSATVLVQCGLVPGDESIIRPRTPPFDSNALCALPEMLTQNVNSILVIRGVDGRDDWIERYRDAGVPVQCIEIYRSETIAPDQQTIEQLGQLMTQQRSVVVVVGSIAEYKGLNRWLSAGEPSALQHWMQALPTVVPHGRIAAALADANWKDLHTTQAGQTLTQAALELA